MYKSNLDRLILMCSKYYREINRQFIDKEGDKSSDSNASEEKYDSSEIW